MERTRVRGRKGRSESIKGVRDKTSEMGIRGRLTAVERVFSPWAQKKTPKRREARDLRQYRHGRPF